MQKSKIRQTRYVKAFGLCFSATYLMPELQKIASTIPPVEEMELLGVRLNGVNVLDLLTEEAKQVIKENLYIQMVM